MRMYLHIFAIADYFLFHYHAQYVTVLLNIVTAAGVDIVKREMHCCVFNYSECVIIYRIKCDPM